jgi:uncharacterized membrane protein YebE (DUF533 family)
MEGNTMQASWRNAILSLTLASASWAVLAQAAPATGAASTPGIDKRQANQERRIDQGVASGQLTKRETRKLEREQTAINRAEDKAKSDGVVTAKERHRIQHAQNQASRDIGRQKHDRQQRAASAPKS